MNNRIIYITGPDGSGKTSYLHEVENKLKAQNKSTKHIWIRSPKITSKPLMVFCRLTGLTKYKVIDGVKYGKHEFYRSNFVFWLYPILQYIDFWIKWKLIRRKLTDSEILLFDRFALDTLADIMVDTDKMSLHKKPIGKAFIRLIPQNTSIIVLKVSENTIRERKKDTLHDEHLSNKITAYKILSKDLDLTIIDNNKSFEEVKNQVFEKIYLTEPEQS